MSKEAFHINQKIEQQSSSKKNSVEDLYEKLIEGDRFALSQAITLVESTKTQDAALANELLNRCWSSEKKAITLGITGSPGVGKSTMIEALASAYLKDNHKVAVLTIDPSSVQTKGSILGDKTRMAAVGKHPNGYVRSSPTSGHLGGLNKNSYKAIHLCQAAGFDYIMVETVGVGQSEIELDQLVDCIILLLAPGAGDELQGIKKGIIETCDVLVINKADGDQEKIAQNSAREYANALHLQKNKRNDIDRIVLQASALHQSGIKEIKQAIISFVKHQKNLGQLQSNRDEQYKYWIKEFIKNEATQYLDQKLAIEEEDIVKLSHQNPAQLAKTLFHKYLSVQ